MPDPSSGLWRAVVRFATAIPPVPPQALSVFHAAVGAAILAGDSARFSGPSFAGARQIAGLFGVPEPRAWIAWGTLLVVVGVVMVFVWPWFEIHHPRLAVATVLFGAVPDVLPRRRVRRQPGPVRGRVELTGGGLRHHRPVPPAHGREDDQRGGVGLSPPGRHVGAAARGPPSPAGRRVAQVMATDHRPPRRRHPVRAAPGADLPAAGAEPLRPRPGPRRSRPGRGHRPGEPVPGVHRDGPPAPLLYVWGLGLIGFWAG
jgi:hypothetical protein